MSREWKPGDVALVQYDREGLIGLVRPRIEANRRLEFAYVNAGFDMVDDPDVAALARPLVVIDPEDREQVERLAREAFGGDGKGLQRDAACIQAALREFANPTPPKPAEPTGLGAVVEDAEGERWVRLDRDVTPWVNDRSFPQRWRDINAVRVLSEGVTA